MTKGDGRMAIGHSFYLLKGGGEDLESDVQGKRHECVSIQ
jgi:hypothetical protein